MLEKGTESNVVCVAGKVVSDFKFSHKAFGEGFYLMELEVDRLSGKSDTIPVMVTDRQLNIKEDYKGRILEIHGRFHSFNNYEGEINHLLLYVFAREIKFVETSADPTKNNQIYLEGIICKKPNFRETSLGRKVADIMLTVTRSYGKKDKIPCIAWGRNANFADSLEIGTLIRAWGRIQSRNYLKKVDELEYETRTAYEVSICQLETPN